MDSYSVWPSSEWMNRPQTDEDLIGYCEIHCKTPRALFSARDINMMLRLAGKKEMPELNGFYSMHEDMEQLCKLARERLKPPYYHENYIS